MLILYITYIDMDTGTSGSSVRPRSMYRAFLEAGYQVKLLSGSQDRFCREKRRAAVAGIVSWLEQNTPDICYIESPVYPILWGFDRALLRRIHRKRIPIGYFYRDFYWKFPKLYPPRKDLGGAIRDQGLAFLQNVTDRLLRLADIVYLPSREATGLLPYRDMRPLPPAGTEQSELAGGNDRTCIYVGGMNGDYGGKTLLQAFRLLNSGEERYPLLLVCRENEWKPFAGEWARELWLEVHHTSGDGLLPLYHRASAAMMPIEKNVYTDLSVNVKIFEYMSFGLPVVSTNVTAVSQLVSENGMGCVSEDDRPESFARAIRALFSDAEALARYRENSHKALVERNLWIHRARQVAQELGGKK